MNFKQFFPFFKKQPTTLLDISFTPLKSLVQQQDDKYLFFYNTPLYHHTHTTTIPAVMFHKEFGIILFEIKEWDFTQLKNASLSKPTLTQPDTNTLAYNFYIQTLQKKYTEITHTELPMVHKYLVLRNLTQEEYEQLSDETQRYLPKQQIFFQDTTKEEMFEKFQNHQHATLCANEIASVLFSQFCFFDHLTNPCFANKEQREFLQTPLQAPCYIQGKNKSGITQMLLLKAILELLEGKKVVIIKATSLAKELLLQQLLALVEYSIISIDFEKIFILTPKEYQKLPSKLLKETTLFCDDTPLLETSFVQTLTKKTVSVFANLPDVEATYTFTKSYEPHNKQLHLYQTPQVNIKALHLISQLATQHKGENILVVASSERCQKLFDDLEHFIEEKLYLIDENTQLKDITKDSLRLVSYNYTLDLNAQEVILLDLDGVDYNLLDVTLKCAKRSLHLVYQQESQQTQYIKER